MSKGQPSLGLQAHMGLEWKGEGGIVGGEPAKGPLPHVCTHTLKLHNTAHSGAKTNAAAERMQKQQTNTQGKSPKGSRQAGGGGLCREKRWGVSHNKHRTYKYTGGGGGGKDEYRRQWVVSTLPAVTGHQ